MGDILRNRTLGLSQWIYEGTVATRCSNTRAIIKWLFVPYILEDEDDTILEENDTIPKGDDEADEFPIQEQEATKMSDQQSMPCPGCASHEKASNDESYQDNETESNEL